MLVKKSGCNNLRSGRATSGSEPPKLLTERKETDGEEKKIELSFHTSGSERKKEKRFTAVQLTVIPASAVSEVDCQGTSCQTRTLVCGELSYWGEGDARSYEIR